MIAFVHAYFLKVVEAIIAFFAALVAHDPLSLSELADKPDFISTLLTMLSSLDHEKDALALVSLGDDDVMLKKIGVVKSEKTSVRILWPFGHLTPIKFI